MIDELERYLAPLRQIDWSAWDAQPVGPLEQTSSFWSERRYSSIPLEAMPILSLGVDGCHYALWIDDLSQMARSPGVVCVSPMDCEALTWVAPSIEAFAKLLRPDDDFLSRDDPAIAKQRQLAIEQRAREVTVMTDDGMGVTAALAVGAPATPRDRDSVLRLLAKLLEQGRPHHALVIVRNTMTRGICTMTRGFGNAVAEVYRALGQPEYAELALATHEPTDEALERYEKINALMAKRFGPKRS